MLLKVGRSLVQSGDLATLKVRTTTPKHSMDLSPALKLPQTHIGGRSRIERKAKIE